MKIVQMKLLLPALLGVGLAAAQQKPNIVFIITDDQDLHLGSLETMEVVQREIVGKGTSFSNHWATTAQCCPSRTSILRGQQAHNTNITDVKAPGGNYDKWVAAGLDENYLPHWLGNAGYHTEYMGKLINNLNLANYNKPVPKGWTNIDMLIEPYMYDFQNPLFSWNGDRPVKYTDWHQLDAMRIKAVDRIKDMASKDKPFFYGIAPTAPHNIPGVGLPEPLARHQDTFLDVGAPQSKNFNPKDEFTDQKRYWLRELPALNETQLKSLDMNHRRRLQSLQGVDELVEDVIGALDEAGVLDNTYIVYTSDNGYQIGNHRIPAGKCLAYRESANLPFVVRGPSVPAGATSRLPGTHVDLAPTFLQIAGVDPADFPEQFDGRSLLPQWHDPSGENEAADAGYAKEIINLEFWGEMPIEDMYHKRPGIEVSTFKSLRIAGEDFSYFYIRWCTNEEELYNTIDDPDELNNLAIDPDEEHKRLLSRLNGLLLVTKSCEGRSCRNPWTELDGGFIEADGKKKTASAASEPAIDTLRRALDPAYDGYFDALPDVQFGMCAKLQLVENERPYYPEGAEDGLGSRWRNTMDFFDNHPANTTTKIPRNEEPAGSPEQRHATYEQLLESAREVTDDELGLGPGGS